MEIEQALPLVLDQFVHPSSFGARERAMLELLYAQQAGEPNGVFLGPKRIAELTGRDRVQAKYDTKALQSLRLKGAVRRVRGSGRTSNTWSLSELRYWRVAWIGRRDQVISFISGLQRGDVISYRGDSRMELVHYRGGQPRKFELLRGGLSVEVRPATESDRPATELAERDAEGKSPRYDDGTPDPETLPMLNPKGLRNNQFEEEERARINTLAKAVAKRIPDPTIRSLQGKALRPIVEAVEKFGDHWNYLHNLAETFTTATLSPPVAAQEFLDLVEERAGQAWPEIRAWSPIGSQPFSDPVPDDGPPMSDETRQKTMKAIRELRENLA